MANERTRISMTAAQVASFIEEQRTATMATIGPAGQPHLVAMWYAVVDGRIWIETKVKSQKVANLRRDDRATFLIEDGATYPELRGVSLEGRVFVSEDQDDLWRVGVSMYERYVGPFDETKATAVTAMIHRRVAVRLDVHRSRSWDHRKLAAG